MTSFYKASTYGNSVLEMSVRQRLTPDSKTVKYFNDIRDNIWTVLVCAFYALKWLSYTLAERNPGLEAGFSSGLYWESERCPNYLLRAWFAVYAAVVCCGNFRIALTLVCTIVTLWLLLVVIAAAGAVGHMYNNVIVRKRLWLFQVRMLGFFAPQMGEIETKQDRRDTYNKRIRYKTSERLPKEKQKIRDFTKKKKQRKVSFKPQMGYKEMSEALSKLANINGILLDDRTLSRVENLGATFLALKDCDTTSQFFAVLFLYLKTEYSKSIANTAATYIAEVLGAKFGPQAGEFGVIPENEKPAWLRMLKECKENWQLVIRNDGFKKIAHVLSLCLALGLCDSADLDFRVGGMKMFALGAYPKQASAVDLIDAAFETIVYFAEGGYCCFQRGSIKPLLYGNLDNEEFEAAYAQCMRCHDYARAGNLQKFEKNSSGGEMDENDYDSLLAQTIEKCQSLVRSCRGTLEKNFLLRKLDTLRMWQVSFRQTRVQGGLRESPYSVGVFGGTAVGKSTIANILMVTTLLSNSYSATDDRIVTINESDKFMSNYRSSTNGVLVDDIGNTKADFVEKAPTTLMIQLVNNVRMYANMAEADMKGKVSVEPKVVISTKNVKDSCATVYSNEPASITRRDRITLTATVKPQYATHDMLDTSKVKALCPHLYEEGGPYRIPDLWDITVERSYPVKSPHVGGTATVGWETVLWGGVKLEKISLAQLIRYIADDSARFFLNQAHLMKTNNNVAGQIQLCKSCKLPQPDVCECEVRQSQPLARIDDRCPIDGYCTACEGEHTPIFIDAEQDLPLVCAPCEEPEETNQPTLPTREPRIEGDSTGTAKPFGPQWGQKIGREIYKRTHKWHSAYVPASRYWAAQLEDVTLEWVIARLDWLETSRWVVWTNWIPTEWIKHPYAKHLIWWSGEAEIRKRVQRSYLNHIIAAVATFLLSINVNWYFLLLLFPNLVGAAGVVEFEKEQWYNDVANNNAAMPAVFKMYRDRHVKWITGVCLVIGSLYGLALVWRALRVTPTPQGNLSPGNVQEIKDRDSEVNPWAGVLTSPMPCSEKAKTTTPAQLATMVEANLCYMDVTYNGEEERTFFCDAFFPKSNVALVPKHMWHFGDEIRADFVRHDPSLIGGNFSCHLYKEHSVNIPDTDLSLVWVPNGGDWKDLTPYLPIDKFASVPARLLYKQESGVVKTSKLFMESMPTNNGLEDFFGAEYNLEFETFDGLCMAPLITETKGPLIGGFHLGGVPKDIRGCCGLLLQKQMEDAFNSLKAKPNLVLAKSSGTVPQKLYDVQFYEGPTVHPKSPVNFLPNGTNCKFYGQVSGRATYHTEVKPTVISKHVEEVCGVPQQWGGPKFSKGYPWQASLQNSTRPSIGIEGSLLERACADYIKPILEKLDEVPELKASVRPLTDLETISGRDGERFIDKMPPNTSVGFPLSGPKSNFLTPLDPTDHPTHQCPMELDPILWKHAHEMEELYLKGERAYPIFKACLKDEPTKLSKDKVRVFQGAPCAFQLLVRKYFLPVARVLSMFPLLSECAVGINAHGPEWDQLAKFIKKFGAKRILAGDYGKYDLRMPAQAMFAAFRIMIEIAKYCGYSKRDITIMEGIATDICYPLMAYNGDLIQHFGSNPSGQNLTVYINSIVNSLLFRAAFFHITKDRSDVPEFRGACALGTYGDDAKSSVHKDFPEFNHIAVANFLKERDMVFTMPDKTSTPTPYMEDTEADFLKRKNVYSEETGMIMGALDESSIFKSLHATLQSKALTKEQQAMTNIDGALREWFCHGREVYETRRAQMKQVADLADIAHGIPALHVSFDDRVVAWKEKYE